MTVALYLQNHVEVLDFAGPLEIFAQAGFEIIICTTDGKPVRAQGILEVNPACSLQEVPDVDILAFFGGNSEEAIKDRTLIDWIRKKDHVSYYFSVCTGAFILAEAGILEGLSATTFHGEIDRFRKRYPEIKVLDNARFVDNGHIITTAGVSAGIDGALHLVSKILGLEKADKIASYIEYDGWEHNMGAII